MERLKVFVAIVLCWILAIPAPLAVAQQATASADQPLPNPPRRQAYRSDLIQGDDRILHALNRFTFGPKPGDLEAVRKMGLDQWFEQQLHPADLDEKDLNAKLANYPAMQWAPEDLMYRAPNNAVIRQALNGKAPMPDRGTLRAVYENQIYRQQLKKEGQLAKKAEAANPQSPAAAPESMNAATPAPSANQNAGMDASMSQPASPDMSMAAPPSPASNQTSAGTNQPAPTSDAPASANQMNPGQANAAQASAAPPDALPLVPVSEIRAVIALAPSERVERLSAMQPDEFESFIKSLKGPQRQALLAGLSPDLRECVEDLENPRQMVVQELSAQRLTRDIASNAQLQG